jgi:hypothetical protein
MSNSLTHRYALGDTVHGVSTWKSMRQEACAVCAGTGHIDVPKASRPAVCPERDCYLGNVAVEQCIAYKVMELTIGQVIIRHTAGATEISYMCDETGIGTGQVWPENRLFPDPESADEWALEENHVHERDLVKH